MLYAALLGCEIALIVTITATVAQAGVAVALGMLNLLAVGWQRDAASTREADYRKTVRDAGHRGILDPPEVEIPKQASAVCIPILDPVEQCPGCEYVGAHEVWLESNTDPWWHKCWQCDYRWRQGKDN